MFFKLFIILLPICIIPFIPTLIYIIKYKKPNVEIDLEEFEEYIKLYKLENKYDKKSKRRIQTVFNWQK